MNPTVPAVLKRCDTSFELTVTPRCGVVAYYEPQPLTRTLLHLQYCRCLDADAFNWSRVQQGSMQCSFAHGRMTAGEQPQRRVTYRHALGESTGLPSASVDLVTLQFVIHEVTSCRPAHFADPLSAGGCLQFLLKQ